MSETIAGLLHELEEEMRTPLGSLNLGPQAADRLLALLASVATLEERVAELEAKAKKEKDK